MVSRRAGAAHTVLGRHSFGRHLSSLSRARPTFTCLGLTGNASKSRMDAKLARPSCDGTRFAFLTLGTERLAYARMGG